MFAKTIFAAALVLAATSLTSVANASAAPHHAGWQEVRMLAYNPAGQSSLCPPGHSLQECFYAG